LIIKNAFDIPLPPDQAWPLLMDVPRIAPCLPGAELLEALPDNAYKGKVSVRLGPVALAFTGTAKFEEIDNAAHTARLKAQGADQKGRGNAAAKVAFALTPVDGGTRVNVETDLTLSGAVAQYGRAAGMLQEVAQQIIGQFARSLQDMLQAEQPQVVEAAAPASADATPAAAPAAPAPQPVAAKPISGFSLIFRVLLNSVLNIFKRK
jgi:carbon monoxide dehydrogenase subunit G